MGFVPGAYRCICNDGFFFPLPDSVENAFTGQEIENFSRIFNGTFGNEVFRCTECAAGCETCVDATPCLHQRNDALIISLMSLNSLAVTGIIFTSLGTFLYRNEMVNIQELKYHEV